MPNASENILFVKITKTLIFFAVIYLNYLIFRQFFPVIFTSFALAVILDPLFTIFSKKIGTTWAVLLTLIIFIILFLLPIWLIIQTLVEESQKTFLSFSNIQNEIQSLQILIKNIAVSAGLVGPNYNLNLYQYLLNLLKSLYQQIGTILTRVGNVLINILLTFFITYFLLARKKFIAELLSKLSPFSKNETNYMQKRVAQIMKETIRGRFFVFLIQSIFGLLGFLIFGGFSPILLGTLYGFLSIIPVFGTALIWVPYVVIKLASGQFVNAIGFFAWSVTTTVIVDHYIAPIIIGKTVKMNQAIVLLAMLGGVAKFGVIGLILGPFIAGLLYILVENYFPQYRIKI